MHRSSVILWFEESAGHTKGLNRVAKTPHRPRSGRRFGIERDNASGLQTESCLEILIGIVVSDETQRPVRGEPIPHKLSRLINQCKGGSRIALIAVRVTGSMSLRASAIAPIITLAFSGSIQTWASMLPGS